MKGSKQLAAIGLVALGLAGAGVAAAAVGTSDSESPAQGNLDEPTTTTSTVEPTTTTLPLTVAPADADDEESGAGAGVTRSTEGCGGETYANHGEYVKSVAKSDDREPGDVAAAAYSPCGKPVQSIHDASSGDAEVESESAEDSSSEDSSHGHGPPADVPGKAKRHR